MKQLPPAGLSAVRNTIALSLRDINTSDATQVERRGNVPGAWRIFGMARSRLPVTA